VILYDEEKDRPLGRGQTMPVRWDGTVEGLPGGVDDAVEHGAALADGQATPESGAYVLPQALVPIEIDRASGRGRYVEPNVWMRHSPRGA
jgi:hypothetical protein